VFLACRSFLHSFFKFLHKYCLLLNNIKIIIFLLVVLLKYSQVGCLFLKAVENLYLQSIGVLFTCFISLLIRIFLRVSYLKSSVEFAFHQA
jgi:hypothetical protein